MNEQYKTEYMEVLFFRSVSNVRSEMELFRKDLQYLPPRIRESIVAYFIGGVTSASFLDAV